MTRLPIPRLASLALAILVAGCAPPQTPQSATGAASSTGPIVFASGGPDMSRYAVAGVFPTATRGTWIQPLYSVDGFSRTDAIWPAASIRRPATASPWKRPATEPSLTYEAPGGAGRFTLAQFMERNPTTGLLIARGDTILVERYGYARTDRHRLTSFSMAKTITAMLIGMAVADGAIASIDDPAARYVPTLEGTAYGRTSLRHLLTMSSGVAFREDYGGADDVARLARATLGGQGPGGADAVRQFDTREVPPGTRWSYASGETQVLGLVLRAALRRPIADYMAERLWQAIGAEADASWLVDRSGQEITFAFFNAVLRDYARLAMLLAREGRVGERQVVPAAWIREATRPHFTAAQTGRGFGYGFQTWVFREGDGSFALFGVRGQAIFVDPRSELVMVHTAVRPDPRDARGAETIALWRAARATFGR